MRPARPTVSPERTRPSPERILFVVAGLMLVLGSQMPLTSYLSPKNGIGYALGIAGGVLLLLQSFFAIRKCWFQWHLLLGILAPVLILMHCGFSLGATNSNIALFSLLLVAGSGVVGRYFYAKTHRATLGELERGAQEIKDRGSKLVMIPELIERLDAEESRLLGVGGWRGPGIVLAPLVIALRFGSSERLLHRYACAAIKMTAARHKAVATQKQRFERVTFDYVSRRLRATRDVAEFRVYERLSSIWHVLHVPLFLILIAAGIVHVVAVHLY
jgi:hypothetical protein